MTRHSRLATKYHQTIKKVTNDMEALDYNTAIAATMELVNKLRDEHSNDRQVVESLVIMIAPFAPHFAEECWERLGHDASVFQARWPEWDEALVVEDQVEMVIQVNGRTRGKVTVSRTVGVDALLVKEEALKDAQVLRALGGKDPKKQILVPNRLLNLLVAEDKIQAGQDKDPVPMYRDKVRVDSSVVLESLPTHERHTGRWLYEKVLRPWADADSRAAAIYHEIDDRDHFFQAIEAVKNQYFRKGRVPILHIEAHGKREGIILASQEVIFWEELREHLTEMNILSQCNLLVVMAMCSGWHISQLLHPLHEAPAWGILGPTEPVGDLDLRNAMETFYRKVLSDSQAWPAVEAMNKKKPRSDWKYVLQTAEIMFCQVFSHYMKTYGTPEQLQHRENEVVAEIVRRRGLQLESAFEAREHARIMLRSPEQTFEFYREKFLMFSRFPSNRERFTVSYSDCSKL